MLVRSHPRIPATTIKQDNNHSKGSCMDRIQAPMASQSQIGFAKFGGLWRSPGFHTPPTVIWQETKRPMSPLQGRRKGACLEVGRTKNNGWLALKLTKKGGTNSKKQNAHPKASRTPSKSVRARLAEHLHEPVDSAQAVPRSDVQHGLSINVRSRRRKNTGHLWNRFQVLNVRPKPPRVTFGKGLQWVHGASGVLWVPPLKRPRSNEPQERQTLWLTCRPRTSLIGHFRHPQWRRLMTLMKLAPQV